MLCRGILLLYLAMSYKIIKHGEGHIRTDGTGTIAQQQSSVHNLTYLTTLYYQGRLHTLLNTYQIVVYGRHCQKRRDGSMLLINVTVGKDDIVHSVINRCLCLLAQCIYSLAQSLLAFLLVEEHRELPCLKALVADVTQYVELGIGKHRLRQAHHLTVLLVRREYVGAHGTYILCKTHHQFFTYRVDGRVCDLCKLLTEIVEEYLRAIADDSQRSIITHSSYRLLSCSSHRHEGLINILLSETEHTESAFVVRNSILHFTSALQLLQLNTVGGQPLTVRVCTCQLLLYLTIVIYLAFLCVNKQYLTWLQTTLAYHVGRVKAHHSRL